MILKDVLDLVSTGRQRVTSRPDLVMLVNGERAALGDSVHTSDIVTFD